MTQIASGEASLNTPDKRERLRLDIKAMMDLEEAFECGILELVTKAFEGHLGMLGALYLAMTGRDFTNRDNQHFVENVIGEVGLLGLMTAVKTCAERTLSLAPKVNPADERPTNE